MSVLRFDRGTDVHVQEKFPNTANPDTAYPVLGGAADARKRILLRPAGLAEGLRGQTVLALTVSVPIRGTSAQFSPSWALLASGFTTQVTWDAKRQPDVQPGGISRQWAAASDGQRVVADITPLGQQIAAGAPFFGFRLATTAADDRRVYGYDSGGDSWVFEATIADDSDAPVSLEPDGGVIGLAQPTLAWQADDGESDAGISGAQAAYRVQVDRPAAGADPDPVAPDYDSGTKTEIVSQHPLAGTAFTATAGAVTYWRVQTRDQAGTWSDWSDWASFTYLAKVTGAFVSPTGGKIYDPSPLVQWQADGDIVAYRLFVAAAGDPSRLRYDSGRVRWTDRLITHQVPDRFRGAAVFLDDKSYVITIEVEDRADRVPSPGDTGRTVATATVVYDDDIHPAPTGLTVAQAGGAPEVTLTFTRGSAPDGWVVQKLVDGAWVMHARLNHNDPDAELGPVVATGPGTWTWVDQRIDPGKINRYRVKALLGNKQSTASPEAQIRPQVTGVWIIRPNGQRVVLNGEYPDVVQTDRRVTYEGINAQAPFDIVYAQLGMSGTFDGTVLVSSDQGLDTALARLRTIRANPQQRVRLVWGEHSIPVELINMSIVVGRGTAGDGYRPSTRAHRVTFGIRQTGEFETTR